MQDKVLVIETVKILEKTITYKNSITLSVIGCVVNGPGEAALTNVGITGGKNGNNSCCLECSRKSSNRI